MASSRKSVVRAAKTELNRPIPERPAVPTADAFQNIATRTGFGTDNQNSFSTYGYFPITRLRVVLDFAYRSSWLCRNACSVIADDMTREGVELGSDVTPSEGELVQQGLVNCGAWDKLKEAIQWSRLYGGGGLFIMIEGQKANTPLRLDTIAKGGLAGLMVLDRWMLNPSLNDLVTDQKSPDFGKPKYYQTMGNTPLPQNTNIHHSRFLRFEGDDLPYYQRLTENLWGMSVLEPVWDRLLSFDQTTAGTAQLVNRAHLRNLYLEKWKETVGTGGKLLDAQLAAIDWMRRFQQNEGITILDSTDRFEALSYTFTGLDAVLIQMGQQISGALGIPLVKLFGQSPAGLNSTGESDIRMYYDTIKNLQSSRLRSKVEILLHVVAASVGVKLPSGFFWFFKPLRQLSETEKVGISSGVTQQVTQAFEGGLIDKPTALRELKQQSSVSGIWTNITDEMIKQAEEEPPMPGMQGMPGEGEGEGGEGFLPGSGDNPVDPGEEPPSPEPRSHETFLPKKSFLPGGRSGGNEEDSAGAFSSSELEAVDRKPHKPIVHLHMNDTNLPGRETMFCGHRVVVEVEKGQKRTAGSSGGAVMAAPYGYFPGTIGNDGDAVDVFLGPDDKSQVVYIIDQVEPDTKRFHQHKVFLGFNNSKQVLEVFNAFYADGRGDQRVGHGSEASLKSFSNWLDKYKLRLSA